jgi:hypothetical protein
MFEKLVLGVSISVMIPVSLSCASLIISYLNSNPPCLQTFNDRIMIEVQYVFAIFTLTSLIPMGCGMALSPLDPDMSRLVAFEIQVTIDLERFRLYSSRDFWGDCDDTWID